MRMYRVFGGISVTENGEAHDFAGRQAALLSLLLSARPDGVSSDRLVEQIWGDSPPQDPDAALHNLVARIRATIGDDLRTSPTGYSLGEVVVDAEEFVSAVKKARQTRHTFDYEKARSLWSGEPYVGQDDLPSVGLEAERLRNLAHLARLEHIDLMIESNDAAAAADEAKLLVETDPMDERALALYMRGLYHSGRKPEALAAFRSYEARLGEETGLEPSFELRELEVGLLLDSLENRAERQSRPFARLDLSITYVERAPGEQIAVGRAGSGSQFLVHPGWGSKLDLIASGRDFRTPFWAELAKRHEVILFDRFGTGLSAGEPGDFNTRTHVEETKEVLRQVADAPVPVMAPSGAGPICITAAAEDPELVSHLVLFGTYSDGPATFPARIVDSMLALSRVSWGLGSDLLSSILIPAASAEHREEFTRLQREVSTKETAMALLEDMYRASAADVLESLSIPVLVIHYTGDKAMPYSAAEQMARDIPNAQLVPLEGVSHYPPPGEEAKVAEIIDRFLETTAR